MLKTQIKFVTLLLSIIFCYSTVALPSYISIDTNELESLSVYEVDFLRKSTYEAIFSAQAFEILLNEQTVKLPEGEVYFKINLAAKRTNEDKYVLEFTLLEIPTGEVLSKAYAYKVEKEKIQLRSRKLLYELLFEEYKPEENITGEIELKEKILNSIEAARKKNSESRKARREKEKKVSTKIKLPNGELTEEVETIADTVKDEDSLKEQPKEVKRAQKPNSAKTHNFESPALDLRKSSKAPEKSKPFSLTLKSKYEFSFGYEKENSHANAVVDSEATLKTITNTSLLCLGFASNVKVEEWEKYFTYGFKITKILSEDIYEIPARYAANIKYNQHLWQNYLSLNFILEYQKLSFVSLTERGNGLEAFTNSALWVGGQLTAELEVFKKMSSVGFAFYKTLVGTSNQSNISDSVVVDGNKVEILFKRNIWNQFGVQAEYSTVTFSSLSDSKFDTSHQVMSLNLTYN